jgi:hypothetical protein
MINSATVLNDSSNQIAYGHYGIYKYFSATFKAIVFFMFNLLHLTKFMSFLFSQNFEYSIFLQVYNYTFFLG